jgi:hypothetical protein
MMPNLIIDLLLKSEEPSILRKTRVILLGESRDSVGIRKLETEIKNSPRVKALLQKASSTRRSQTRAAWARIM